MQQSLWVLSDHFGQVAQSCPHGRLLRCDPNTTICWATAAGPRGTCKAPMALADEQDDVQSGSEQGRSVMETGPLLHLPSVREWLQGPCAITLKCFPL